MMFMNNDRGGLGGFTHILVPGSEETGRRKLIGRMPQDSWGKILQILLGGKTVVRACVHVHECERRNSQQRALRVYGYDVYVRDLGHKQYMVQWCENEWEGRVRGEKIILWMLWNRKVEDNHSHRVFRSQTRAPQKPRTSSNTQGDASKGHLRKAHQRPSKSKQT